MKADQDCSHIVAVLASNLNPDFNLDEFGGSIEQVLKLAGFYRGNNEKSS